MKNERKYEQDMTLLDQALVLSVTLTLVLFFGSYLFSAIIRANRSDTVIYPFLSGR